MKRSTLFRSLAAGIPLAAILAAAPALAGGQSLSVEFPAASSQTDAVVLVHSMNCGMACTAPLQGRAEGMVKGERRSVPLKLKATTRKGVYAVSRQWPAEGRWVLVFNWKDHDHASALVRLDGAAPAKDRAKAQVAYGPVSPDRIQAALAAN